MAEHKHGEMNIDTQVKVFDGFIKIVTWACVLTVAFLVFVALVNG